MLDISSVKHKSYGGSKFWGLIVDDCTDKAWTVLLKKKSELPRKVVNLIKNLKALGMTVKYIRCDNAGENESIEKLCEQEGLNVTFEYTPRDSPQYNGRVERKFATLWGMVRSMLNAAKLDQNTRRGVWAESAKVATELENALVRRRKVDKGPSFNQFHQEEWKGIPHLHQFGEMAVIKTGESIQSKLKDKGTTMMYVGRAMNHAKDVHRFLNPWTRKVTVTRDVSWLNQVYGDWKGLKLAKPPEIAIMLPPENADEEADETNPTTAETPTETAPPSTPIQAAPATPRNEMFSPAGSYASLPLGTLVQIPPPFPISVALGLGLELPKQFQMINQEGMRPALTMNQMVKLPRWQC